MEMAGLPVPAYLPRVDALDHHEYVATKNRKIPSTGGSRAWSEDEVSTNRQPMLQQSGALERRRWLCMLEATVERRSDILMRVVGPGSLPP